MAEYIEREKAKEELLSWAVLIRNPRLMLREDALCVIDSIPAAEVEPVVHGHWERRNGAAWCSACKRYMNHGLYGYRRCGLCGAHMDEEVF